MPSWLSDWVGTDMAPLAYYALVAVIVLVLIVVVLSVARKMMGGGTGPRVKNRGPRLAVMDVASIDPKRKLVLVRRDEIEHLILIGGQNDLVVEAGILRVAANARVPRSEPTMRPDLESEDDALRVARQPQPASRTRRAPPAPVAAQPPMPAPSIDSPARPPEQRSGSPLSRPVPRPAPAVRAEPAVAVPTVEAVSVRPQQQPSAPAAEPAVPPVAAVEPPSIETRSAAPEAVRAERAPAMAPPVEPPAAPQTRPSAPPVEPSAPPAVPPVVRTPAAPEVAQPIAVDPSSPNTSRNAGDDAQRAARPSAPAISRVAVGGGNEPIRRPLSSQTVQPIQPIQPVQPRSMATPTYPMRSAAAASAGAVRRPDEGEPTGDGKQKEPTSDAILARLLTQGAGATETESVDAAADRDGKNEAAKADGVAGVVKAAGDRRAPAVDMPGARADLGAGPTEPKAPVPDLGEIGDRRPLSVRSFASAIQTRQGQGEPASAPSQAAAPVASPVSGPIAARRDPEPTVPPIQAPGARMVFPVRGTAQPMPPAPSESMEDAELEDFLSAQLNTELNDDIWTANEAPKSEVSIAASAPPVMPDSPVPTTEAPRVEAPRVETPRAEAPRVEAIEPRGGAVKEPVALGKPRTLTLEEEMERLLGDFDLETTDRRLR